MKYETDDIVLATVLKLSNYNYTITKVNGKGTFHFAHIDKAVLDDFINGKIRVEPNQYDDTKKVLVTAVRMIP